MCHASCLQRKEMYVRRFGRSAVGWRQNGVDAGGLALRKMERKRIFGPADLLTLQRNARSEWRPAPLVTKTHCMLVATPHLRPVLWRYSVLARECPQCTCCDTLYLRHYVVLCIGRWYWLGMHFKSRMKNNAPNGPCSHSLNGMKYENEMCINF